MTIQTSFVEVTLNTTELAQSIVVPLTTALDSLVPYVSLLLKLLYVVLVCVVLQTLSFFLGAVTLATQAKRLYIARPLP